MTLFECRSCACLLGFYPTICHWCGCRFIKEHDGIIGIYTREDKNVA